MACFGFKAPPSYILDDYQVKADHDLELPPRRMAKVVRRLLEAGWHVEAEGKLYRQAGELKINVTTGVDWFDVNGQVDFDGKVVALPALLAALRRGENTVVLDDGTLGMLPEAWLKKFGLS